MLELKIKVDLDIIYSGVSLLNKIIIKNFKNYQNFEKNFCLYYKKT